VTSIFLLVLQLLVSPQENEFVPTPELVPQVTAFGSHFSVYELRRVPRIEADVQSLEYACDTAEFEDLVTLYVVGSLFKQDGVESDDGVHFNWQSGELLVFTNTEEELTAAVSLIKELERLATPERLRVGAEPTIGADGEELQSKNEQPLFRHRFQTNLSPAEVVDRLRNVERRSGVSFTGSMQIEDLEGEAFGQNLILRIWLPVDPLELGNESHPLITDIRESVSTVRSVFKISHNFEIVIAEVRKFSEKYRNRFQDFEFVEFDPDLRSIYFELSASRYHELEQLVRAYSVAPFLVRVKINVVEMDEELQRSLGTQLAGIRWESNGQDVLSWIGKFLGSSIAGEANLALNLGKASIDVLIDSIEKSGRGKRHLIPEVLTLEFDEQSSRPTVIETSLFPQNIGVEGVGFRLQLDQLRVLESSSVRLIRQYVNRWVGESELESRSQLIQFTEALRSGALIEELDASQWGDIYFSWVINHSRLNDYLRELQVQVRASVSDGSITRYVPATNDQPAAVDIQKTLMDFNVIVDHSVPVLLGGSTAASERVENQKVPLLGDLPLIGGLFRNQKLMKENRSNLIFLTVNLEPPKDYQGVSFDLFTTKAIQRFVENSLYTDAVTHVPWVWNGPAFGYEVQKKFKQNPLAAVTLTRLAWHLSFEQAGGLKRVGSDWTWQNAESLINQLTKPRGSQFSLLGDAVLRAQMMAKEVFDLDLNPYEILTLMRLEGWFGGDPQWPGQVDDRMFWVLAVRLSKEFGEPYLILTDDRMHRAFERLEKDWSRGASADKLARFEQEWLKSHR
jgi:hypothetical protein